MQKISGIGTDSFKLRLVYYLDIYASLLFYIAEGLVKYNHEQKI